MIELKNVFYNYGALSIFENFSLQILDNQIVSVIGESGAGKSTFLDLLLGFISPKKGEIFFDEIKLSKNSVRQIRQQTAWLPQNFNVAFDSVSEMFFSPFNLKANKTQIPDNQIITNTFKSLGLDTKLLEKGINEISGGQKQRIMLAAVFLLKKKYYLLDEPTSALDDTSAQKLLTLLKKLKINSTIIISTHDQRIINQSDLKIEIGRNKISE